MSGQPFLQFKSNGKNIKHIFFRLLNVISQKNIFVFHPKKICVLQTFQEKTCNFRIPIFSSHKSSVFFSTKKKNKAQRWVPLQVERLNSKVRDIIPYPSESDRNAQSLSYFHAPETQKKRMFGWKGMRCEVWVVLKCWLFALLKRVFGKGGVASGCIALHPCHRFNV